MAEDLDFNFRGLRIRVMDWMPADSMMICGASNSPQAIYTTEKGWRGVDPEALAAAHTLVLSVDIAAEIARRMLPLQAPTDKDK